MHLPPGRGLLKLEGDAGWSVPGYSSRSPIGVGQSRPSSVGPLGILSRSLPPIEPGYHGTIETRAEMVHRVNQAQAALAETGLTGRFKCRKYEGMPEIFAEDETRLPANDFSDMRSSSAVNS